MNHFSLHVFDISSNRFSVQEMLTHSKTRSIVASIGSCIMIFTQDCRLKLVEFNVDNKTWANTLVDKNLFGNLECCITSHDLIICATQQSVSIIKPVVRDSIWDFPILNQVSRC